MMDEKLVFKSTNLINAEQVCSILKDNNIPFVKKYAGPGEYFDIIARNTFGRELHIYVSEEDLDKANDLINEINANNNESIEITEIPDELKDFTPEEEEENEKEYTKNKKIKSRIFKLLFLLPWLLAFILAITITIIQFVLN